LFMLNEEMIIKPISLWFILSIIASIATKQLITAYDDESVENNLRFKIDTAKLTIIRSLNDSVKAEDIEVSILSDICYQCAFYTIGKVDRHSQNKSLLVDTKWPLTINLNTTLCNQSTYYHFGEYGEYEMNFIINSSSNCKIKVVKVKEPVNSMLPILVAFCTLFGLAVVYLVAEKLWVLKKEKIETDVPLIQEVEIFLQKINKIFSFYNT